MGGERLRGTRRRRGRGRGRGEEDDRRKGEEIFVGRRKWKRNGWKSCDEVYIYVCVRGRWKERKRKRYSFTKTERTDNRYGTGKRVE